MKRKAYITPDIKVKKMETGEILAASGNQVDESGESVETGETSGSGGASGAFAKPYNPWSNDDEEF